MPSLSLPALIGTLLMPVSSLASWFLLFALGQTQAKPGRGGMRHPYSYLLPVAGFYWLWACKVRPRSISRFPPSFSIRSLLVLLHTIVVATRHSSAPFSSPIRSGFHRYGSWCVLSWRHDAISFPSALASRIEGLHTAASQ
jgi:hypothetical protein